ncbi:MAG: sulfite exporter TauE/SafE family protein [Nitrospirota bacterium]|nr:sulfite exporter TauE/SafE family protein [Nitrospirota bacterium]
MSFPKKVFEYMEAASVAHAKWDYETSMNILKSKKKILILIALAAIVPILIYVMADAADILGGKKAYAPSFYATNTFLISIAIGFCAGLITGCIGAGGGFIITPALMAAGVKGILAVGTDLFHIFAKAIMGSVLHKKLGNVNVKIAAAFLVGSVGGATLGGYLQKLVYAKDPILSDAFLSIIYALILGFLSWYGISDVLKKRKLARIPLEARPPTIAEEKLAFRLQSVKMPPAVKFDEDMVPGGRKISGVLLAAGGFLVGIASSLMGVGGGFITFPLFVYVFGISTFTTVGTDIFQIIFTAGYAGISQYAIYGFVFYTLAMGLLLGSLIGIQIGALTTKVVKGVTIRLFWVTTILAGFINRVTVLPKQFNDLEIINIPKSLAQGIETAGFIIFWVIIITFVIWVLINFLKNLKLFRED